MKCKEKIIIGRSDIIDLPEFNITNIKAKIDTGAYTSSIHCSKPKITEEGGKRKITFRILDKLDIEVKKKKYVTEEFSERIIKNSFGNTEKRYVIRTKVLIFGQTIETEFSLSNRSNMKHPVLLGRKFLMSGEFVVDVSRFNLSYNKKRRKSKKNL